MIEVGEYVKIKEWNVIGKILKITSRKVYIDSLGFPLTREQIYKHSKNIVDLIEEGDYINGAEVIRIFSNSLTVITRYGLQSYTFKEINEKKYGSIIESIVTKEQFAQAEYKIKEDK